MTMGKQISLFDPGPAMSPPASSTHPPAAWIVFVAPPAPAPVIAPQPSDAPSRPEAETEVALRVGVEPERCLALPTRPAYDLADRIQTRLEKMNARAEEDLRELRELHAEILGCTVEEIPSVTAAREAEDPARVAAAMGAASVRQGGGSPPRGRRGRGKAAEEPAAPLDAAQRRLEPRQRELLALVRVEANRAIYTGTDRVPDWGALKSVVEALGGKWTKGGKKTPGGWGFPDEVDAAEVIRLAQDTGEILDPKRLGFFATPRELADVLVGHLRLWPGIRVLEPSAGHGALALAVLRAEPGAIVECCELLPANRAALTKTGVTLVGNDIFSLPKRGAYDAVIMNPPFAAQADIDHVTSALEHVRPGGQLAAIMSAGVKYRTNTKTEAFRSYVTALDGEILDNLPGSFLESGTAVNTVRVIVRRGVQ